MAVAERHEKAAKDRTVAIAVIVAAHAPFVLQHFRNLWRYRPHYEFFPLILAAFAWLVWKRWPRETIQHTRLSVVASAILLLLGFACLSLAVVLFSPWLGAVAAFFSTGGLIFALGGRTGARSLLPVWLMLCLLIPPPFRLDDQLIRVLQRSTAETGSAILDSMHFDHVLTGNVFRLPGRELFVAEACSGVNSLLTLIAFCALLVILLHRTPLHTILLLITTPFWSGLLNAVRVTVVVLAAVKWDVDISTGWVHSLLGYALVIVGFALLLSTDQLLIGLLFPVLDVNEANTEPDLETIPLASDPLSRCWNFVVAHRIGAASYAEQPAAQLVPGLFDRLRRPRIAAIPFVCLGVLQIVCLLPAGRLEIDSQSIFESADESWLPQRHAAWNRKAYRTEERDRTSDEGQHSCIWEYSSEDRLAQISMDFPFLGWHELTRCYTSQGWTEVNREVLNEDQSGVEGGPMVQVKLRKQSGDVGFLLFCMYDGAGRPVIPRSGHWAGVRGKLARNPLFSFLMQQDLAISADQTTLQIQQFIVTSAPLNEAEIREVRQWYGDLRQRIRERWLSSSGRNGT